MASKALLKEFKRWKTTTGICHIPDFPVAWGHTKAKKTGICLTDNVCVET